MGLLLKIALFAVALYGVWGPFPHWKGLYDRFIGKPDVPPPPSHPHPAPRAETPPAAAPPRKAVIEDTVQCAGCGAYISTAAQTCGHCGRPRS